jgi:hypothetical protein
MDYSNHRIGMQHWASEGIAGEYSNLGTPQIFPFPGRGQLKYYFTSRSRDIARLPPLGLDPITTHKILMLLNTFDLLLNHSGHVQG